VVSLIVRPSFGRAVFFWAAMGALMADAPASNAIASDATIVRFKILPSFAV